MSWAYVTVDPSSMRLYELIRDCASTSRVVFALTLYATTDRLAEERRRSSHARKGSVLECTMTVPFVSYSKRLRASSRQAFRRTAKTSCVPSGDQSNSA